MGGGVVNKVQDEVPKNEINLQFHWYLFAFFISYIIPILLSGAFFISYLLYIFIPNVLNANNILSIFFELNSLLSLLFMPIVILICYVFRLFILALITRILWNITEKKSPSKNGIIPRNINSKTLDFYHIRSFLIKYPKHLFTKGMFPWLITWMYNFVGSNKIGKGTVIEEQVCGDRFIEIGDNSYIGVNCVLTSHLVEGIFGNAVYFKLKIGNNTTLGGWNCFASGTEINDNSYLLPSATGGKHYIVKGENFYFGMPLRKIFKKKIEAFLDLSPEDLEKNKMLAAKQKKIENNKNHE